MMLIEAIQFVKVAISLLGIIVILTVLRQFISLIRFIAWLVGLAPKHSTNPRRRHSWTARVDDNESIIADIADQVHMLAIGVNKIAMILENKMASEK